MRTSSYHVTVIEPAAQPPGGIIDMHGSLLDERCIREKGTSLKDRQQKTVTASGKPAFHPPDAPARTMRSWKCHAPMPVLPTSSLSSPFRESIAGNADSIKNVGHSWAGGMYGQPVLRCLPDTVKKGFRPTPSQAHGRRPRVQILPRSQKGKALTMDVARAFFVLSSFPSCGKALRSATAFRLPSQALPQLQHEARPGIARCVLFIVKDGPDGQILLETETFL